MNISNRTHLILDLAVFAGFLLATMPRATGETIHEWFSLALGVSLLVHLLLHWKWVVAVTRRFFDRACRSARWNYMLDAALFVAFVLILFSGVLISKSVLPFLGLQGSQNIFWRWLHSLATNLALLIVGLHVALHWKWIVACLNRFLVEPLLRQFPPRQPARPVYRTVDVDDDRR